MSRLEKFIKDNREAFDSEMPSKDLWQGIEAAVPQKQVSIAVSKPEKVSHLKSIIKWSIAATVLLFTGTAIFLMNRKTEVNPVAAVKPTIDTSTGEIAAVLPDAAPEVSQIAKLIVLKQEELKALSKEQPELYQKFTTDINQLDSSYRTLKNQLSVAPNKEMLIEAMVQNLQLQLNVLNQQLKIINQIKQTKKYSHEKNKSFT